MSPRSAKRYRKFAKWLRPLFSMLDAVAVQEEDDIAIWQHLGVGPDRILDTGSLKFDPGSGARPAFREDFQQMLDSFGKERPVILAASTHSGEEEWIGKVIRETAPHALPVIAPRHAERRSDVKADLERAGFEVVLRSSFAPPVHPKNACLVLDSTGELRDWTAHADVVIIGKSFLSTGGQNPCEAILAEKPVICGPHMQNFQPLVSHLAAGGGCLIAKDSGELAEAIVAALDPETSRKMTQRATAQLTHHEGATVRIIQLLSQSRKL